VTRGKILHYQSHQIYLNRPDPIAFMTVAVDTSGRIYDDFSRLLFLHAHREESAMANEFPEESDQFRFLRAACLANLKGSVPLDLSSRSFIPLSRFIRSRRPTPFLASSLILFPPRST
jgi:hypothetical protein